DHQTVCVKTRGFPRAQGEKVMRTKIGMAMFFLIGLAISAGLGCKKCEKKGEKEVKARPDMVKIPAGCFMMGDPWKAGFRHEYPVHKVCITRDFYLDIYEVTNDKYEECVKAGKCKPPYESTTWTRSSYYGSLE